MGTPCDDGGVEGIGGTGGSGEIGGTCGKEVGRESGMRVVAIEGRESNEWEKMIQIGSLAGLGNIMMDKIIWIMASKLKREINNIVREIEVVIRVRSDVANKVKEKLQGIR